MEHKFLLPLVLTMLVLLTLAAQGVYADSLQITNVIAPSRVGAGQPVTIILTVSYDFTPTAGESLALTIRPHTESGNSYTLTGSSRNCHIPSNDSSLCFVTVNMTYVFGQFTASITLDAPQTPGTWQPTVFALIMSSTANIGSLTMVENTFSVVRINVT